jgi:pantoate--beta-alanine ligase
MEIIRKPEVMQRWSDCARAAGARIAVVPTMGFLHQGHLTLMREGLRRADALVVTLFVNPAQFGPNEDFARYPRDFERDCAMMETVPVDAVFAPEPSAMYPCNSQTWVEVTQVTRGLCGPFRPGHFRGVTTIVAKLFNVVKPHLAVFGEKDFQQLRAIQRMVIDLNFQVEIVPVPIVRESDGLAMSSRNAYLTADQRERALALSFALRAARDRYKSGACCVEEIVNTARRVLERTPGIEIEYVEGVHLDTLEPASSPELPMLLAIAARVGRTRLIDNAVLRR